MDSDLDGWMILKFLNPTISSNFTDTGMFLLTAFS